MGFVFQKIKTPPRRQKGELVIISDDGYKPDYTHWFQLFLRKNREHNSWVKNIVPFSPAVNTSRINKSSGMTDSDLLEIKQSGGEIVSHGHYHIGLLPHELENAVESGATSFRLRQAGRIYGMPVEYAISEGDKSEIITIVSRENVNSGSTGTITLSSPLMNSYTQSAVVRATKNTAHREWRECIDYLKKIGLNPKNHVWPYNHVDDWMKAEVVNFFRSARGAGYLPINVAGAADRFELKGYNLAAMTNAQIDLLLTELIKVDGVGFIYAHAEKDLLGILEYTVDECVRRGVAIVTFDEGLNKLNL